MKPWNANPWRLFDGAAVAPVANSFGLWHGADLGGLDYPTAETLFEADPTCKNKRTSSPLTVRPAKDQGIWKFFGGASAVRGAFQRTLAVPSNLVQNSISIPIQDLERRDRSLVTSTQSYAKQPEYRPAACRTVWKAKEMRGGSRTEAAHPPTVEGRAWVGQLPLGIPYDSSLNWFVALSREMPVVRYLDLPVAFTWLTSPHIERQRMI